MTFIWLLALLSPVIFGLIGAVAATRIGARYEARLRGESVSYGVRVHGSTSST
jgi:hypothetical protein